MYIYIYIYTHVCISLSLSLYIYIYIYMIATVATAGLVALGGSRSRTPPWRRQAGRPLLICLLSVLAMFNCVLIGYIVLETSRKTCEFRGWARGLPEMSAPATEMYKQGVSKTYLPYSTPL